MTARQPLLTISESTLTFIQTSIDKPCFLLLTVAQQHVNTPITITTDTPDYFLLATDKQPTFTSSITFVPSAKGTYVHVRYYSTRRGPNRGMLTIESPYDSRTVWLEGRTNGLLPAVRHVLTPSDQRLRLEDPQQIRTSTGKGWILVLVLAVIAGLGYTVFRYHCQLFPGSCQQISVDRTAGSKNVLLPVRPEKREVVAPKYDATQSSGEDEAVTERPSRESAKSTKANQDNASKKSNKSSSRHKFDSTVLKKESELERELNRQPDQ